MGMDLPLLRQVPVLGLVLLISTPIPSAQAQWPQFRGPTGDGHVPADGQPPIEWSEKENVRWMVSVPGEGFSSPVIHRGKVFLTTAFEEERSLSLLAFDAASGESLWQRQVFRPDAWQTKHPENSQASPTPVAEDDRIYVHFGAYGTAALSIDDGQVLWRRDDLVIDHETGPGSSPILYRELLIVNFDGTDDRFVAAFHKQSGELAWRAERSRPMDSAKGPHRKAFSTPLVVPYRGRDQLVSPAAGQVSAYDPLTGEELWRVLYEGYSNVPRPVAGFGRVYVTTGYMKPRLLSIHLGGQGDVTDSRLVWSYRWQVPANPSPLLIGPRLFLLSDWGRATWLDAHGGDNLWRQRLDAQYSASPIYVPGVGGAPGRIYTFSHEGETVVLEAGDTFEILARNRLDGVFRASPAVIGNALVLRTTRHLYRIETTEPPTSAPTPDPQPAREPN